MRAIAIVTGSVLALGLSALAPNAGAAGESADATAMAMGQEQPAASKKNPGRRICRMVMPTGSRLPNRSCRTQEEWDREAAQYQRDAEQQRRNHESVQPGAFTRAF